MRRILLALLASFWMATATAASIDINTASAEDLMNLQGIGPKKAEQIVAYREMHGSFESVDDLVQVKGIGERTLEGIRDQLEASNANP